MATFPHTPTILAKEVLMLLIEGGATAAPADYRVGKQVTIDCVLTGDDLKLPLNTLSTQSLKPIAAMLLNELKNRLGVKTGLVVPHGSNAAVAAHNGVEVRVVQFDDRARFDMLVA